MSIYTGEYLAPIMKIILMFCIFYAASCIANAGEYGTKFAVVNMQKIEQKSDHIKDLAGKISDKRKKHYDEFQKIEKSITKDVEDLKTKASILSSDKIKKEEMEIQKKIDIYSKKNQQQSKVFEIAEAMILKKLNDCMLKQVSEISKKNHYDFVFQSSNIVYYSDNIIDITDSVIEKFDDTKCKIDISENFKQAEKEVVDIDKK